jgi:hypothetical protein
MDKVIQFIANYDDWVSIKKLKIEPGMDPCTVMEFLAGLGTGIDSKIEQNLGKVVEIVKLDNVLGEALEGVSGKGEAAIAKALAAVNSRAVSLVVNEITAKPELQKNEKKELQQFCKVYATRKALKELGLMVDYSGIEIPGMKRVKRTKV